MNKEGGESRIKHYYSVVTLFFVILAFALHLLAWMYWKKDLEPRLQLEAESQASVLANSQANVIINALENKDVQGLSQALELAISDVLLFSDPTTNEPFFTGVGLEVNYLVVEVEMGTLDNFWGASASDERPSIEVALYSAASGELLGIAHFTVSPHFFDRLNSDIRNTLFYQSILGSVFLFVVWGAVVVLIRAINGARLRAEAANRAKSTFLANMSHELRTPLNAIIGFTQIMMRSTQLSSNDRENLSVIGRGGEHLLKLINSVLEMSKIEAGMSSLDIHSFNLFEMVDSLDSMMGLRADRKGLTVSFECAKNLPQYIRTDEGKLRQTLINLVGNAIKFTDKGSVTVRVNTNDFNKMNPGDSVTIWFEVEDTGMGVAAEEKEKLFEAFNQSRSGSHVEEGTGLGLAISRQFVRMMGGDITVTSIVGNGATFKFNITAEVVEAANVSAKLDERRVQSIKPGQRAKDGDAFRLLIVDDIDDNRILLRKTLEEVGFIVKEAADGQEAIDVNRAWKPHLIWMDLRMPILDGYQATKRIREETKRAEFSPFIIALTAHAFEEERAEALAHGCDEFVRKPFREHEIFDVLHHFLGVEYSYEELSAEEKPVSSGKGTLGEAITDGVVLLSSELICNLEEATQLGDMAMIDDAIEAIRKENASLGDDFAQLAKNFAYDDILELLKEAKAVDSG